MKQDIIPDFTLIGTNNFQGKFSDFKGTNLVLFFYPKDNTPICTSEAKAFRDNYSKFNVLNTKILGISRDTLSSHERFKAKLNLPFELISDTSEELCNYFDVIKFKNFFGKKIRGISRSTFLIDKNGVLQNEWRKVKVSQHIDEIIKALNEINS